MRHLRGIGYLVAFFLTALGSWGQQSEARNPWGWLSPSDQRFRELDELENKASPREGPTEPALRRPLPTCILEPFKGFSNTVSVRSLQVPEKVQNEYQKACSAWQTKKLTESEKHLRKALQIYSEDAFGWVMLGKLLEATERWDEATKACTQAVVRDPSYWPAEVCLAEIDAHQQKWKDSVDKSNRAVSLNTESKRLAYYISAIALLNLQQISAAESRALEAEKLDGDHQLPGLRLLLAKIDVLKGDLRAAETQLRDCLKYAKGSIEGNLAKQELAQLASGPDR
jgi:tetratricopeptide (TPR) repeat protein